MLYSRTWQLDGFNDTYGRIIILWKWTFVSLNIMFCVPEWFLSVRYCRACRTSCRSLKLWPKPEHLPRLTVLPLPVSRQVSSRKLLLFEVNMKYVLKVCVYVHPVANTPPPLQQHRKHIYKHNQGHAIAGSSPRRNSRFSRKYWPQNILLSHRLL